MNDKKKSATISTFKITLESRFSRLITLHRAPPLYHTTNKLTTTVSAGKPRFHQAVFSQQPSRLKPTMPAYTLTYFDLRARAEPARLILAQAGVEYEDKRLPPPFDEEGQKHWASVKPSTPFGTLPILAVDGVVVGQSMTVARLLAREHGLSGKTNLEAAQADEIVDGITDATEKQYTAFLFEKDEAKKAELQKKFNEDVAPTFFKNMEARLEKTGGEFFAGNALSWADILMFHFASELPDKTVVDKAPKVAALVAKVGALPNIKKWVESRPQSAV